MASSVQDVVEELKAVLLLEKKWIRELGVQGGGGGAESPRLIWETTCIIHCSLYMRYTSVLCVSASLASVR